MKRSAQQDPATSSSLQPDSKKRRKEKESSSSSSKKKEKRKSFDNANLLVKQNFFAGERQKDFSDALKLKSDHSLRPIWVCPDYHIFLETFSPIYQQAYDFLVAIAEPVSRPENIHEYKLTEYSLYAAVSIGLNTEKIIEVLEKLSKVKVPKEVAKFIEENTKSYGKVKLVLQHEKYFVESPFKDILIKLLDNKTIAAAAKLATADKANPAQGRYVDEKTGLFMRYSTAADIGSFTIGLPKKETEKSAATSSASTATIALDDDEDDTVDEKQIELFSFEIELERVEEVKKECLVQYPMLEEYDFKNDAKNPTLAIDLKPITQVRSYQEKSLSKMFSNGRARSGIIVLPCGAGKTLVGITATCTVKKRTLVLCINAVSVEQWRNQFLLWTNVNEKSIRRFTSLQKDPISADEPEVVISTYNMVTYNRNRNEEGRKFMDILKEKEWGLIVLDEVHVVPADMFRKVISVVKSHCKLGLTATLLREDDKTDDLYFLIGPKMYEANWLDLQRNGHLAKVECIEVWCPMTPEFYAEYLKASPLKQKLLYVMNPNKYKACEFLVRAHEKRGDKVIVFSDNVFALEMYARKMNKPFIYGDTSQKERVHVLNQFQQTQSVNTVFISKVGDTAIDLPEATVIIQISSHFGSRRQEAQRLGRILRPKKTKGKSHLGTGGQAAAYFYSLVSQDTMEMYYSSKRQQFLIDQGYSFQVVSDIKQHFDNSETSTLSKREELELLSRVLREDDSKGDTEKTKHEPDDLVVDGAKPSRKSGRGMGKYSGADGAAYTEIKKSATHKHPIFKKRQTKKK